ncbi:V-type sodium ATPase subunit G [Fervidicola ferrireducens]|uniref:V-type sodium ATPase subunit G n=1 Tax=Fervidicola ferrireducens TaxID=520764 RepID=A0A140LBL9_9FIRM|nr:V-type ATP synthase subunit F [Fervidicola ferrireducens]KXG77944.1 V-type sodium ATPase subunit G [Fervidicola ferrireducens]
MYKIGVIADHDTALSFKSTGIDTFPTVDESEAAEKLLKLARENYAVIFITEYLAEKIMDKIDLFRNKTLPIITLIPSNRGTLGIGITDVKKSVEKAIGVDIIFEREGRK